MKLFVLLVLALFLLNGCSTRGNKVYSLKINPIKLTKKTQTKTPSLKISKNTHYKTKALYKEYNKWRGTQYQLGGNSLSGIDCSSLIQQVYFDAFGLKLPRTTALQVKAGVSINKAQLQAGDMIFFKTSWDVRHVGIIIKRGKFIHASTSQGVTIADVQNPYWRDVYWTSRRVLP